MSKVAQVQAVPNTTSQALLQMANTIIGKHVNRE